MRHHDVKRAKADDDPQRGVTTVLGHSFDTTGLLGVSEYQGEDAERGFPSWITLPAIPLGFSAKIPKVQKPRWLTEEYATSFFMSFCTSETSAP